MIADLVFWGTLVSLGALLFEARNLKMEKGRIWLIVLLAFFIRFVMAKGVWISIDEVHHVGTVDRISHGALGSGAFSVLLGGVVPAWPPGFHIIAAVPARILGDPWLAVKWTNLFLSSLSVYLIYLVCRELGGERAGFAGALMLTVLPVHLRLSKLALIETANVFFFLLSVVLYQKKHKAFPLALSCFILLRVENFLVALLFLGLSIKEPRETFRGWQLAVLAASLLVAGLFAVSYLQHNEYIAPIVSDPLVFFKENVVANVGYFFDCRYFSPLVTLLALANVKKERRMAAIAAFIFVLYTFYAIGTFVYSGHISRYAAVISTIFVVLASQSFSKRKLPLLILTLLMFVPALASVGNDSTLSLAIKFIENDSVLSSSDLVTVSNLHRVFGVIYPERQAFESYEIEHNGTLPSRFILSRGNFVNGFVNVDFYASQCDFTRIWNYSLGPTTDLYFYEVVC